jgi:hypothetical protein
LYLSLFALADIKGWVMMRPHLFVLPILVVWTGELLAARKENRAPRWFLMPLMVLWANLHPSFLFGAALIASFGSRRFWTRRTRDATAQLGRASPGCSGSVINPAVRRRLSIAFTAAGTAAPDPGMANQHVQRLRPLEATFSPTFSCLSGRQESDQADPAGWDAAPDACA